jgi:hypothetical protein
MSSKRRKAKQPAVEPLHPLDVEALNRAFYAADPADYFARRFRAVVALAAQTDGQLRAEERVYNYGSIQLTVPDSRTDPPEESGHERFVLIEAEMLVHHLAETLLRMFFAHAVGPDAPWTDVSKLRGLGEFKRRVEGVFRTEKHEALRRDIAFVFLGHREPPADLDEAGRKSWGDAVDRIGGYVSYFGQLLLDRADTYNAAKHGMAMQAGSSAIQMPGVPEFSADGPSIAHLGVQQEKGGKGQLVVKTRWLEVEQDLAASFIGIHLLRGLWLTARIRYVGWPVPGSGYAPYVPPHPVEKLNTSSDPEQARVVLTEVAFPPAYFAPPGSGVDSIIKNLAETAEEGTSRGTDLTEPQRTEGSADAVTNEEEGRGDEPPKSS